MGWNKSCSRQERWMTAGLLAISTQCRHLNSFCVWTAEGAPIIIIIIKFILESFTTMAAFTEANFISENHDYDLLGVDFIFSLIFCYCNNQTKWRPQGKPSWFPGTSQRDRESEEESMSQERQIHIKRHHVDAEKESVRKKVWGRECVGSHRRIRREQVEGEKRMVRKTVEINALNSLKDIFSTKQRHNIQNMWDCYFLCKNKLGGTNLVVSLHKELFLNMSQPEGLWVRDWLSTNTHLPRMWVFVYLYVCAHKCSDVT